MAHRFINCELHNYIGSESFIVNCIGFLLFHFGELATDSLLVAVTDAFLQSIKGGLARMERKVKRKERIQTANLSRLALVALLSCTYLVQLPTTYVPPNSFKMGFAGRGLACSSMLCFCTPLPRR